jgi:hypothetical protein
MTNIDLERFYVEARDYVFACGYEEECRYYGDFSVQNVSEQLFLTEYSWVVLNSGFRESTVRRKFNYLSLCFYDWVSAEQIITSGDDCVELAMPCFGNKSKLNGIVEGVKIYTDMGGLDWASEVLTTQRYRELEVLPFIGPVTSKHLAKNLGVSVVKPDRHLVRFAETVGRNLESICNIIVASSGDNLKFVDTVLWRYFALTTGKG